MSDLRASLVGILAIAIYGLGLLAPLTPSEGMPSILELVLFAGTPSALLILSWGLARSLPLRTAAFVSLVGMAALTAFLLSLQSRTS